MPRAQVQPARDDMASVRLPEARSDRGVPPAQGRPSSPARRRLRVPRTVLGIGAARLAKEALESSRSVAAHARWARAPGSPPAPSPGSADVLTVRRQDRPRALRRARPGSPLLPRVPGRAPRSARSTDAAARGRRTIRKSRLRPRPAPCPRLGVAPVAPERLARRSRPPRGRGGRRASIGLRGGALARAGDTDVEPIPEPCPRERADELSAVRSWLARNPVRLIACDVPLSEPVDGGARIATIVRWTNERDPERPRSPRR